MGRFGVAFRRRLCVRLSLQAHERGDAAMSLAGASKPTMEETSACCILTAG
jgi:hypothetical protein